MERSAIEGTIEALTNNVAAGIVVLLIIAVASAAWARDRIPIKVRSSPRQGLHSVAVDERPEDSLPPSFVFPDGHPTTQAPDEWDETQRYIAWALASGGVHMGTLFHRFTIRGVEDNPVRLERIAVRVLDRRPPITGYVLSTSAGGDSTDRWLAADLDHVDPAGYARTEQTVDVWDSTANDFVSRPWNLIQVSKTDSETFVLAASTELHDCDFEVEVHYAGKHNSGILRLQHGDKPFRVTP